MKYLNLDVQSVVYIKNITGCPGYKYIAVVRSDTLEQRKAGNLQLNCGVKYRKDDPNLMAETELVDQMRNQSKITVS